jgi:serine/threonine-protein kinase
MSQIEIAVGARKVRAVRGDIVRAGTEAIVNAANSALAGGSGVDGAIHRAAGPELYDLTRPIGGCPTGSAVITGAGRIPPPTTRIIHAVGPVYSPRDDASSARLLRGAYKKSLELATAERLQSIAFPAISTGVYGYPKDKAAPIAVGTVIEHLRGLEDPDVLTLVLFVLFSDGDLEIYREVLGSSAR